VRDVEEDWATSGREYLSIELISDATKGGTNKASAKPDSR
jgi:hypothetical protein